MAAMMATERLWRMTGPGPEPVARNAVSWRPMPVLRRPVEPAANKRHRNTLLNHLVSGGEQRGRHGEAERLGCLEVHHQFELGWLLDRKVGRLRTLENLVDE